MSRGGRARRIERIVRETIENLPPSLAAALERAGIVVDLLDAPPPELPDAFGAFVGGTAYDLAATDVGLVESPRIELYLSSFEGIRGADFEEEVRRTVLHEIGHFLGFGEEDLEDV